MTLSAANWGGTSRFADLDGPVHYVDFGGPADAPRLVLVHGLGGSHLNWCLLAPELVGRARVVAVDLAGFGLTHPQRREVTVPANTRLLDRFLREVVGAPAVLVGNSMGGMISIRQAAACPETVAGLVLVDPALPLVLGGRPDPMVAMMFAVWATPVLGKRLMDRNRAALPARRQVKQVLNFCCADSSVVPEELIGASVELLGQRAAVPGLDAAFQTATRSVLQVNVRARAYWAAMAAVRAPVFLMHGERDRLVSIGQARVAARRNPDWHFQTYPGVGHLPQLEAPALVGAHILDWLEQAGAPAARRAS